MACTWIIQTNMAQNSAEQLKSACAFLNKPVMEFKLIPFTTRMRRLGAIEPFVLMGSTTLNRNAAKSRKYSKGMFFNPETFKPEQYARHYGELHLNHDARIMKIKDVDPEAYPEDEVLFIRSNDDSKQISGGTVRFRELLEIQKNTASNYFAGDLFTPESEVCLASFKEVEYEWRFVVVDQEVIAGSRYRPSILSDVPDDAWRFAQSMVERWAPHSVFVLDVCLHDGEYKVVECNCFNGSGFYAMNLIRVVEAVSSKQETLTASRSSRIRA